MHFGKHLLLINDLPLEHDFDFFLFLLLLLQLTFDVVRGGLKFQVNLIRFALQPLHIIIGIRQCLQNELPDVMIQHIGAQRLSWALLNSFTILLWEEVWTSVAGVTDLFSRFFIYPACIS
ncbi:hypothetical protein, partial [uncultured Paenibacillus sp.]|uniref:hypothetical protein n=1 Tax=uncultured Paenibacillus sp. TaxID=227322 RepID=UPI0028D48DCD